MDAVDMVRAAGFDVVEAENADEAILILEDRLDITVVFTDIQMPGSMSGRGESAAFNAVVMTAMVSGRKEAFVRELRRVACVADFRITCPEARFAANFTKLGFHPGFGLTVLLPEIVGKSQAELLFYTGRRIGGEEATRIGLASLCVPQDQVRVEAVKLAAEIAESAPLAVISTRATMRGNLADRVKGATDHEQQEQT